MGGTRTCILFWIANKVWKTQTASFTFDGWRSGSEQKKNEVIANCRRWASFIVSTTPSLSLIIQSVCSLPVAWLSNTPCCVLYAYCIWFSFSWFQFSNSCRLTYSWWSMRAWDFSFILSIWPPSSLTLTSYYIHTASHAVCVYWGWSTFLLILLNPPFFTIGLGNFLLSKLEKIGIFKIERPL